LILQELQTTPPSIEGLRMIEARAALAYFLCWREFAISWKGIGRKPIPSEWHRAGLRQGVLMDGTNRHATHPVNAMLNYAYACLESQVRIAAATYGLDPTIGYLHAVLPRRLALVYDLMEPLRPHVDRMVLEVTRANTFSPADFVVTTTGVCRLHPQLARRVAQVVPSADSPREAVRTVVIQLASESKRFGPGAGRGRTGSGAAKRGRPSRHGA
jgi:CRISPR-associated endonuclease Cas1